MLWNILIFVLLCAIGGVWWWQVRQDRLWRQKKNMPVQQPAAENPPPAFYLHCRRWLAHLSSRLPNAENNSKNAALKRLLAVRQERPPVQPQPETWQYVDDSQQFSEHSEAFAETQTPEHPLPEPHIPQPVRKKTIIGCNGRRRLSQAADPEIVPFEEFGEPEYRPQKVGRVDWEEITLQDATRSLHEAALQEWAAAARTLAEAAPAPIKASTKPMADLEIIDLNDPLLQRTREKVFAEREQNQRRPSAAHYADLSFSANRKPHVVSSTETHFARFSETGGFSCAETHFARFSETCGFQTASQASPQNETAHRWQPEMDIAGIQDDLARRVAAMQKVRRFDGETPTVNLQRPAVTRRNATAEAVPLLRSNRGASAPGNKSAEPEYIPARPRIRPTMPQTAVENTMPNEAPTIQAETVQTSANPLVAQVIEVQPVIHTPPQAETPVVRTAQPQFAETVLRPLNDFLIRESVDEAYEPQKPSENRHIQAEHSGYADTVRTDMPQPAYPAAFATPAAAPAPSVAAATAQTAQVTQTVQTDCVPSVSSAPPTHYTLPDVNLLLPPQFDPSAAQTEEALLENSITIEEKLAEFKVKVNVVDSYSGPVITRYEIEPDVGVRGSAVLNLEKDLARSLGVASIRVVETIPGKTCMGLELPNPKRQVIRLSEIFNSQAFRQSQSKLTLALGQDITGEPVVTDLAKAPHLLVAGTTGSGKSVGVNAMILSMLFKATPEEVRMIMIDPKMLELSIYEGIPHLLAPVVTDMKLAANALNWCVNEMEKRYNLMSHAGVRNLAGYNEKIVEAARRGEKIVNPFTLTPDNPEYLEKLPYIVVVVDEFADLMMTAGKKIEELIARLAQKARAAGIHLILATQRPSVDVITGLIKANIPTRIAFQVSSKIDSRTILDQMGAENLLGQGDMLFLPPGTGYPQRVHGAFASDDEVHHVVEYLKQFGEPDYVDDILGGGSSDEFSAFSRSGDSDTDPMYDEAVAHVVKTRKASISGVQRALRIGYNRAARLIEQMETDGIVSPPEANGNRNVLAPSSSHLDD
ncbi:DNA translocase FtsK [Neisseria lisongii]|uniref:Cell division protein FtsK n=1 Tax=Neisseria lisongii TaxID=2912188 RepID=A0AAW5AL77_9NEIS|nr:DNA translocase FtsK [Neisseria lisongii]MCF7528857.1 cell division protein FtsK [Neisseria lisongii]